MYIKYSGKKIVNIILGTPNERDTNVFEVPDRISVSMNDTVELDRRGKAIGITGKYGAMQPCGHIDEITQNSPIELEEL